MIKMECDYNKIMKNLWIGNSNAAQNDTFIKENNIKYIINITRDVINKYDDLFYVNIRIKGKNINHNNKIIYDYFNIVNEIIKSVLMNNGNILVHCKKGHSRSAVFICAYLIKYSKLPLDEIIKYMKKIRPTVLKHQQHIDTLINYRSLQN